MIKINKLLKKHRNDWSLAIKDAQAMEEQSDFNDAIVIYEAYLERSPRHAGVQELLATALLRTGQFQKSLTAHQKALKLGAHHPAIYLHKGIVEANLKQQEKALESFNEALRLREDYPLAHNNLGKLLGDMGRFGESIQSFDAAIGIDPDYQDAHFNKAVVLIRTGDHELALEHLDRVLALEDNHASAMFYRLTALEAIRQIDLSALLKGFQAIVDRHPAHVDSLNAMGNIYKAQNQFDQALAAFDRALEVDPYFAAALSNRGIILNELQRYEEALGAFNEALQHQRQLVEPYVNRVISLIGVFREEEALASADQAIVLNPQSAEAFSNRGLVLIKLMRFGEALESLSKAIQLHPNLAEARSNLSDALWNMGQTDAALENAKKAIELQPDLGSAHNNLGIILLGTLRLDEALRSFDQAIALDFKLADAHFNRSLLLQLKGDFLEGLKAFEWRWRGPLRKYVRDFGRPLWLGDDGLLDQKTVLLASEQGLGDAIQMIRYLPLLASKAKKVIVEAPLPLMALFKAMEIDGEIIQRGESPPEFDVYCPLMSLPLAFKTDLDSIPNQMPYLRVPGDRKALWESMVGPKKRPRIGLAWSGSTAHRNDYNRSIPLALFEGLLRLPFEFHVLQKDIREGDQRLIPDFSDLNVYTESLRDFADTAALVAHMDLVISVDTSVAHLTGALGVPLWILLPLSPDYRWMLDRCDSPWYPGATLWRQQERGNWATLLERIEVSLLERFKDGTESQGI
jgi:tetratricopeptide (TPR) repeat protein